MAVGEVTVNVEARTYGLWRVKALATWARFMPTPQWLIRAVVASAGIKVKAHAGPHPRRWQRTPLQWTKPA